MAFFGIQIIENGIHLGWRKCLSLLKTYKSIPVYTKRKKFEIKNLKKFKNWIK